MSAPFGPQRCRNLRCYFRAEDRSGWGDWSAPKGQEFVVFVLRLAPKDQPLTREEWEEALAHYGLQFIPETTDGTPPEQPNPTFTPPESPIDKK